MRSLFHIPIIGNILTSFNDDLASLGFQKAAAHLSKQIHMTVEVKDMSASLETILKSKRVVIVANHPSDFSVLALISTLPVRKNMRIVINRRYTGMIPHLDEYCIPVYVDHHIESKMSVRLLGPFYRLVNHKPYLSPNEEHVKNVESITIASEYVNLGGLVIVFPGFPEKEGPDSRWFSGIGHLLNAIEDKNTHIIRTYLQEPRHTGLFRIFSLLRLTTSHIAVHFAEPIRLHEVYDQNPKRMTQNLEARFKSWTQKLNK